MSFEVKTSHLWSETAWVQIPAPPVTILQLLFMGSLWNVVICVIAITESAKIAYKFSNVFFLSKGTFL